MTRLGVTLQQPPDRRMTAVVAVATLVGAAVLALPVALGGNTTYTIVAGHSMEPSLESGDLVITRRQASYDVGDVVVYEIPEGSPGAGVKVIHRIVADSADGVFRLAGTIVSTKTSGARPTTTFSVRSGARSPPEGCSFSGCDRRS